MHAGLCSRTVSARAQPCVALRCMCSASTRDVDAGSAKLRLAEGILRHAPLNLQPPQAVRRGLEVLPTVAGA